MVRFLLEAGADQEHKTDEMHTALMEASMGKKFVSYSKVVKSIRYFYLVAKLHYTSPGTSVTQFDFSAVV